jgi:hypothetical protein
MYISMHLVEGVGIETEAIIINDYTFVIRFKSPLETGTEHVSIFFYTEEEFLAFCMEHNYDVEDMRLENKPTGAQLP